jgi:two-component system phosphate regulon sensor histidine kinase PhoR
MAQSPTFRRAAALILWLAIPTVVVFAGLALVGELKVPVAIIGALLTIVLALIPIRALARDFARLTDYAARVADGAPVSPPDVSTETAGELISALERLRREQRARDATLAGLLDMHESLFDSLPGPTFLLNAQRRITRVNRAARSLFGDKLRERDLATVLRHPELLDAVERAIQGGPGAAV